MAGKKQHIFPQKKNNLTWQEMWVLKICKLKTSPSITYESYEYTPKRKSLTPAQGTLHVDIF